MNYDTEIKPVLENLLKGVDIPDFKSDNYLEKFDRFFDNIRIKVELKKLKEKYKPTIEEEILPEPEYSFLYIYPILYIFYKINLNNKTTDDFIKKLNSYLTVNDYYLKQRFFDILKQKFFIKDMIYILNKEGVTNPTKFVGSGCFGNVFDLVETFAVKLVMCQKQNFIHEEMVGKKVCNEIILEKKIPNLIYTYGSIKNEEILQTIQNQVDLKTEHILNSFLYLNNDSKVLFIEYKDQSVTLKKFLKENNTVKFETFREIFDQIFLTLKLLNDEYKMSHNDLHCENIIIKKNIYARTYPLEYSEKYFIEKRPEYIPFIIDYGFATFIDPVTNLFYGPNTKKSFFATFVDNDIYLLCLNTFKYVVKYKVEDKHIYNYLYSILTNNFLSSNLIEKLLSNEKCYYDLIFKRYITKNNTDKNNILNSLVSHLLFKKNITQKQPVQPIKEKDFYEEVKKRYLKYTDEKKIEKNIFMRNLIKNFYFLSFLKNDISIQDLTDFLRIYDKKKIDNRFYTETFKNMMKKSNSEAFQFHFSTTEKLTEFNVDIYEDIMKDYGKESAYTDFNKEKFLTWYTANQKNLFFYIVYCSLKEDSKIPIGFVGFKNEALYKVKGVINKEKMINQSFFIEIYLKKEYTGKGLGELIYKVAEERFLKEDVDYSLGIVTLYASIFKDNTPSISFFSKTLGFEEYKTVENVVVLKKKN